MALSGEKLDDLIKPELREEWDVVKAAWFPRTDTPESAAYDKRTPGELLSWYLLIIIKLE